MGKVVLCVDTESLRHPDLIGLDGVSLDSVPWLVTFSEAQEARDYVKDSSSVDEVWVVSSDEISAINLAAAMKYDTPKICVYLIAFETTGSLLSCTKAAQIDGVFDRHEFVMRYTLEKQRRAQEDDRISGDPRHFAGAHAAQEKCISESFGAHAAPQSCQEDSHFDLNDGRDYDSSPEKSPQHVWDASDLQQHERAGTREAGSAFVLSVVSGSGGVGKSTIATLLAFCAQSRGYRTLLLDCDLQFGDLHYFMGIDEPVRIEDVLADPQIVRSLPTQGGAPALVASLGHMEQADSFACMLPQAIDILGGFFDVIIVNTGASWAEHHAVLLECSTRTLFLLDQRASSIRACRRALDLCKRCGIASGTFAYALNRCSRGALLSSVDASCALQGVHVVELSDGGTLIEELFGAGLASQLWESRNELCTSIDRTFEDILPLENKTDDVAKAKMIRRHDRGRLSSRFRRGNFDAQEYMSATDSSLKSRTGATSKDRQSAADVRPVYS